MDNSAYFQANVLSGLNAILSSLLHQGGDMWVMGVVILKTLSDGSFQ